MELKFKAFLFSFLGVLLLMSVANYHSEKSGDITIDRNEAKEAYQYLNKVRANPAAYSKSIGVNLQKVESREPLKWSDILAKVAENKAKDMLKRNYFSHVDPEGNGINIKIHQAGYELNEAFIEKPSDNYFESIQGGVSDGKEMIDDLIIDEDQPDFGHRKHLLGIGDWNKTMTDIGIGMAKDPNSTLGTITVVIIAKHDF